MSEADFDAVLSVNLKVISDSLGYMQDCCATCRTLLAACGSICNHGLHGDMLLFSLQSLPEPKPLLGKHFCSGLPPGLCLSAAVVCLLLWLQGVFLCCQAAAKQMVAQVCHNTAQGTSSWCLQGFANCQHPPPACLAGCLLACLAWLLLRLCCQLPCTKSTR